MNTCSVDGCVKPTRRKRAELCGMHYHRQYRGKPIGDALELKRKSRSPECHIDGCTKPDAEAGLCSMHGSRRRRHGNPEVVIAHEDRNMPAGASHPRWVGEEASYSAVHSRVKRLKGPAAQHDCVDCGLTAQHWSYDHRDPEEKLGDARSANLVAYSTKLDHYSPRCVVCHKRYDLNVVNANPVH